MNINDGIAHKVNNNYNGTVHIIFLMNHEFKIKNISTCSSYGAYKSNFLIYNIQYSRLCISKNHCKFNSDRIGIKFKVL